MYRARFHVEPIDGGFAVYTAGGMRIGPIFQTEEEANAWLSSLEKEQIRKLEVDQPDMDTTPNSPEM